MLLAGVVGALLVVQPAELLQNLGVIRVTVEDPAICALCCFELKDCEPWSCHMWNDTYLFLLLIHVTNLEPDVLLGQWARRVGDDVFEALGFC